jgi:Tfp pilus assembly protein PilF
MRQALEQMLAGGRDDALLRFSLGGACLKDGDAAAAAGHFARAVQHDPGYSAAWKHLGQALLDAGRPSEAAAAWTRGIGAAEGRGDIQAAKEMRVFLKRLQKKSGEPS